MLTSSDVSVRHYYSFHRVLFPSSSPLGSIMDASRVVVVFVRRLFPFSLLPFLYLGVLVFPRFRWTLDSAIDAFNLLLLCRDLTLSTIGVPLIAPVGPI